MANMNSDPEIQDWKKLLIERKALHKVNQKEKFKSITSDDVKRQLSEEEAQFLKSTPNYRAFTESAMEISTLSKILYIRNRASVTSFYKKFNTANDHVKKAIEEIIKKG